MSEKITNIQQRIEVLGAKGDKPDPEILALLEDISAQRKAGFAMVVTYEPLGDGKQKRHIGFAVNDMTQNDLINEITSVAAQAISKAAAHPEISQHS